jgi:hypothetical protein
MHCYPETLILAIIASRANQLLCFYSMNSFELTGYSQTLAEVPVIEAEESIPGCYL